MPKALRFSEDGDKFAGVLESGLVAIWRVDAPRSPRHGGLCLADWAHACVPKRGMDVLFMNSSSSLVAVAGYGGISLWDINRSGFHGPVVKFGSGKNSIT